MAHSIKKQASVTTLDQSLAKKSTVAQLWPKKPTAVQTVPGPASSSSPFYSRCRGNIQLTQDLFSKDDTPFIYTRCQTDLFPEKSFFEEDMGYREKQRDEDMIESTFAEEESKDEEV